MLKSVDEWQAQFFDTDVADDPEIKANITINAVIAEGVSDATHKLITHFSSWTRLKVAVGWFLKLRRSLQALKEKRKQLISANTNCGADQMTDVNVEMHRFKATLKGQMLTVDDLTEAETSIVRFTQMERFHDEIAALSAGKSKVKKESTIYKLDPVYDEGLLRVGGRLSKASMPEEMKHLLILAKDQHVSTLILHHIHEQLGHGGRNHVLSHLRKRYWITSANAAVRKVITGCYLCRCYRGKVGGQKMAALPAERIIPDLPPFTNVGVDYFGPTDVKRGRNIVKRYGVLFTCIACRAVHLEVAYSLDTDSCINALRRFICRRGPVSIMRSDNGTNFPGAERELREALASWNQNKMQRAMAQQGVKWNFNPPTGSHHGGVWERVIRMVRRVLNTVLRQQCLDDEGFHTLLCKVEAILNTRPITRLSDDPNDLEALTPNCILLMKGKPMLPPGLFEKRDLYTKRRWKQVQYLADLFWKRWTQEYLPLLQERQRWNQERRNFSPGDVVVVVNSTAPRGSWVLGRILQTFPDKKGLVRSVQLQTKTNIIERPVTKICLLCEAAE